MFVGANPEFALERERFLELQREISNLENTVLNDVS